MQRIIRDHQEIYANKLYNLEEMDKCLGTYSHLGQSHEEIRNMNEPVTTKEIDK